MDDASAIAAAPVAKQLEAHPIPLRRNRDFAILWSGQAISTIGSGISGLAFPLLVLALTHSPARAGIVGMAAAVPAVLFVLPAGALGDRWDRKRIMLVADGARALVFAAVAALVAAHTVTFAELVIAAFLAGAFNVFFGVCESAALPQVVPEVQLPQAIAQNQARQQGAGVISQPLGGYLFGLGRMFPFLFDAVSYLVSFVSLLFVRPAFQKDREPATSRIRTDIGEGVRWLVRQRFLRIIVCIVAATNLAHAALGLTLVIRSKDLGASPTLIGVMLMLFSAGAIVGSVIAPWVRQRIRTSWVIIGSLWLWAADTIALAFVHSTVVLGVLAGAQALTGPWWNVIFSSYLYLLAPDRLLSRVQAAAFFVTASMAPAGPLAAGVLIQAFGTTATFLLLAVVFVATGLIATAMPTIRSTSRLDVSV